MANFSSNTKKPYELVVDVELLESALKNGWDICNISIKWTRYMPDVVLADHDSIINAVRTIIPPVSEYDPMYKSPCWHPTYDLMPVGQLLPIKVADYVKKIGSAGATRLVHRVEQGPKTGRDPHVGNNLACLPAVFFGTVPKTASTTMYDMLTTHALAIKTRIKEPFWFSLYAPDLVEPSISQEVHLLRLYSYLSALGKPSEKALTLDASTFTLFSHGPTQDFCVISRVTSTLIPNAKFVVTLRAPWHRLYSELWWNTKASLKKYRGRYYHNKEYFHRCATTQIMWFMRCLRHSSITSCIMEVESLVPLQYQWRERFCFNQLVIGMYYVHIQTWLKFFPRENFLFIRFEDFKDSPYIIMNEIADFLGISHFKSGSLKRQLDHPGNVLHYPPMEPQTLEVLKKFYMPFNKALANFLGDDKFLWKNA